MKIKLILAAAVLFTLLFAAGCGGEKKTVYIQDARCRTEVTVPVKATVREILAAAELSLGEKDELSMDAAAVPEADAEIGISRFAEVTVKTEDGSKTVALCGGTVADALKESGVTLGENDAVNYDKAVYLSDVTGDIVVTKMFLISLTADGETEEFLSPKATVQEILDAQGCTLGEIDRVTPEADSIVQADTEIVVQRVEKKVETARVTVPYGTQKEYSNTLNSGKTQVKREGVNGSKEVTYEVTYVDGVEVDRTALSEKVIKSPVDAIVVYGTKKTSSGGSSGGRTVVSRERVYDCDGSGHGYEIVTYSDGSVAYVDF